MKLKEVRSNHEQDLEEEHRDFFFKIFSLTNATISK